MAANRAKDLRQIAVYQERFDALKITRAAAVEQVCKRILAGKNRYQLVEAVTGVPWIVIGLLHDREAACNFNGCLANGQNFRKRTTIVPAGYGPWPTWEDSAVWALNYDGLTKQTDWSAGAILEAAEDFNGEGYWNRGVDNPYLFSGSQFYKRGKYVRDRVYDPNVVDEQVGVAPVLKRLLEIESDDPTPPVVVAADPETGKLARADKQAIIDNSRALTWGQRYDAFCEWLGLSISTLFLCFEKAWPYISDWKALVVFGILGGGYIASKLNKFHLLNAAARGGYVPSGFKIPAADGETATRSAPRPAPAPRKPAPRRKRKSAKKPARRPSPRKCASPAPSADHVAATDPAVVQALRDPAYTHEKVEA